MLVTPSVHLTKLTFNDGTYIRLEKDSIVVFTGANNTGKSQVLKDIEKCLNDSIHVNSVVVKEYERSFEGNIADKLYFEKHFMQNHVGLYQMIGFSEMIDKENLVSNWEKQRLINGTHNLFVHRLSTELRLTSSNAVTRMKQFENHPIYQITKNSKNAKLISEYFREAFGCDLIIDQSDIESISLHVGNAPDMKKYTMDKQDEYYAIASSLPKLQDQGDGMRSFASILLNTFTDDHSITLIDEPEAFLHPPQARIIGKMLAKNKPNGRQMFISTHSEDFLQGLLDADCDNVLVIRMDRQSSINRMSVLDNTKIRSLWRNPLLRYSNILSGIFHEKVVICESDYDCLFYQAVMDSIYEQNNAVAPDILFTHCGGKTRIKDVVKALKAVNVSVVAIADFDVINQSHVFKPLAEAFGINWKTVLEKKMKVIYDSMNAKSGTGQNAWDILKKVGKSGFIGEEFVAYESVEEECKKVGLFVVPVGEMECFDKSINKEKKEWVYHVLEECNLANDFKLKAAREFVREICDL